MEQQKTKCDVCGIEGKVLYKTLRAGVTMHVEISTKYNAEVWKEIALCPKCVEEMLGKLIKEMFS